MNNKKLITICIAIIVIAIIVCGIINVYNEQEIQKELNKPIVFNNTIEGIGTFQSTNCTNFTNIKDDGNGQIFYKSNWTGAEISVSDKDKRYFDLDTLQGEKVNDSPKGHTIYKTHADIGEGAGQVRYTAVINDNDNNRIIMVQSPNKNITDLMIDSFKVLQPVKKQETKNTDKITEDTTTSNSQSSNEEMVWSNGGYTEKGRVDIIKKYGMGPESEQKMKEAGY